RVEALLAEAHPLAREAIIEAQVEPDDRGEAGQEPEDQPKADGRLAEGLERREQAAVRKHRFLEEALVPADGIPRGELGDALGLEGEEARGHRRIGNHIPEERESKLGPHSFDKPRADHDAQQDDPAVGADHGHEAACYGTTRVGSTTPRVDIPCGVPRRLLSGFSNPRCMSVNSLTEDMGDGNDYNRKSSYTIVPPGLAGRPGLAVADARRDPGLPLPLSRDPGHRVAGR